MNAMTVRRRPTYGSPEAQLWLETGDSSWIAIESIHCVRPKSQIETMVGGLDDEFSPLLFDQPDEENFFADRTCRFGFYKFNFFECCLHLFAQFEEVVRVKKLRHEMPAGF